MPFNAARFEAAKFKPRTAKLTLPDLAPWFDDGELPEWEVRNLTAAELHYAMSAADRQGSIESIVRAIGNTADAAEAIRKAIGLSKDTPGEIAKRLEMLVAASVNPKITLSQAVKLAEVFPIEFLQLSNKISELTGLGAELVKPNASSQTIQASADQCISSTSEGATFMSIDQTSSLKDGSPTMN